MVILGIDPGTSIVGFGVIRKKSGGFVCEDYGCIKTAPKTSNTEKLLTIEKKLDDLIKKIQPDKIAVEKLFFFKNIKTAVEVAQARGVILAVCARNNKTIYEFTPLQIKQAVSCYGRADKKQVQKMVKLILNLKDLPKPDDAADALACAITCANSLGPN